MSRGKKRRRRNRFEPKRARSIKLAVLAVVLVAVGGLTAVALTAAPASPASSDTAYTARPIPTFGNAAVAPEPTPTTVPDVMVSTFHDDFTTKPDGTLTGGTLSDSGHIYTVLGQKPFDIASGALTHAITASTGTEAAYATVRVTDNPDDKVGLIWVDFEVPSGADPMESLTLVASSEDFSAPGYGFAYAGAHLTFNDDDFRYDKLEPINPGVQTTALGRGEYPALTAGTYKARVDIRGSQTVVTAPDGRQFESAIDTEIDSWNGQFATIELYQGGGSIQRKALRILRWGAEVQ